MNYQSAVLEKHTGAVRNIENDHANIHLGLAFTCSNKMDVATTKVGAIQLTVPATTHVHFKPVGIAVTGGPVIVSLLEGYNFTGGSAFTPMNRNRNSSIDATVTVKTLADITANHDAEDYYTLDMLVIPGASQGALKVGAAGSITEEWVLKGGKTYLVTFTNTNAQTVTVGYELFWYEELA